MINYRFYYYVTREKKCYDFEFRWMDSLNLIENLVLVQLELSLEEIKNKKENRMINKFFLKRDYLLFNKKVHK